MTAETTDRSFDPEQDSHIERLLDMALEETFPASDPVAIALPRKERRALRPVS
jgi:hypothetical protein